MKKKIMICICILILSVLCGCGNSTDNATSIEEDFLAFMNEKLLPVEQEERAVMEIYNSYFTGNKLPDPDALLQDLDQNILPQYQTFMEHLSAIKVKTEAVQDILNLYYDAMDLQMQSLEKVKQSLEESNDEYQKEATTLLRQAVTKYEEFQQAVKTLAEKYQITIVQ